MTEAEINRRYIYDRLSKKVEPYRLSDTLIEEVRKMLQEAYVQGLEQERFNHEMEKILK